MEISESSGVANDLSGSAPYRSGDVCHVSFNGRRSGNARIAAASFHLPIPVVAFDRRSQVGSSNYLNNPLPEQIARTDPHGIVKYIMVKHEQNSI